jgi:hypothetical protein
MESVAPMRLLIALLLSIAALRADSSDRIPNTKKMLPVRTKRAALHKPVKMHPNQAKGGAMSRAFKRVPPGKVSKVRSRRK